MITSIILSSNLKKINWIDEIFDSDELIQIYKSMKTNYRLMEIAFYERNNFHGGDSRIYKKQLTHDIMDRLTNRNQFGQAKIKNSVYYLLMVNSFTEDNHIANLPTSSGKALNFSSGMKG